MKKWTADKLLELGRSYQAAAVFLAAAELDLFSVLASAPCTAKALARMVKCNPRGIVTLLDALTALQVLKKAGNNYKLTSGTREFLISQSKKSILAITQHQANCLRNWSQLAQVVKTGHPAEKVPSLRGASGDAASFIGGMHNLAWANAEKVIHAMQPFQFTHLMDVGGASGTWTMAFLRACPKGTATLFDLPHVIPMAKERLSNAGMLKRVKLVSGDFMADRLPGGADLVWLSAIVHQNSRRQNRQLFANIYQAMVPGGRIGIRDIVMEANRVQPASGALFAINMLVATKGGGTYTLAELEEDLCAAGFIDVRLLRTDEGMNAVAGATKPR